ncbi:MAG: hypothetical protein GC159_07120 [Phycisphaera sp.]|nr:hypothetical protein [Phycisphaera sp.]
MTDAKGTSRNVRSGGFTIVELMVVVSIIILLLSILMPAMRKSRDATWIAHCASGLHQLELAVLDYNIDHFNAMPTAYRTSSPFTNYFMKENTNKPYVNLGIIWDTYRDTLDPQLFYCVSKEVNQDEVLVYDAQPDNPWDGWKFRSAYLGRMLTNDDGTPQTSGKYYEWRARDYASKVIYSDFPGTHGFQGGGITHNRIFLPHRGELVNRLFGDGSVRMLRDAAFLAEPTAASPTATQMLNWWQAMDKLN